MGLWKRLASLASPGGKDSTSTSAGISGSAVAETPATGSLRRVPLPEDGRQAVVGEKYRQRELRAVTRGVRLPRIMGDNWGDAVSTVAELHPEPSNPHDANAVRVEISGKHVGYLPARDAPDYQPLLLALAQAGQVGTCEGRLMIGPEGDISVFLHLGSPEGVAFALHAPEGTFPLSPAWSVTVTGEEDHQDVLRQLAPARTGIENWETATLGFCTIAKGKFAGQPAIEVCLGGKRVGQLTRAKTEQYEKLVRDAIDAGKTPICRASLSLSPDRGVQVRLMMPEVK